MGRKKPGSKLYYAKQPSDRPIGTCPREDMIKQTTAKWTCTWEWDGVRKTLTVPRYYIYDGASVPRLIWSLVGLRPDGLIRAASLAHDALFRAEGGAQSWGGCALLSDGETATASYTEANWVFWAAMRYAGMYKHRCAIAHRAISWFGRRHWGGPMPALR